MVTLADLSASEIIEYLKLEVHPSEGGYFRRTYTAQRSLPIAAGAHRPLMSSIFYLLTAQSPWGVWHRNRSDIMHYYQGGGVLHYEVISPEGEAERFLLGPDLAKGQRLQLLVPGGYWKRSGLIQGPWALVSEAVTPGFNFADNEVAGEEQAKDLAQIMTDQCLGADAD